MRPDLGRFVVAQAAAHDRAVAEITAGRKRTHWMWFIFPQLRGLGQSRMAQEFGIVDLAEARDYLAHPLLGLRLRQLVALVGASDATPEQIFGPDTCKYRSCLTLFALAEGAAGAFERALHDQSLGHRCQITTKLLGIR